MLSAYCVQHCLRNQRETNIAPIGSGLTVLDPVCTDRLINQKSTTAPTPLGIRCSSVMSDFPCPHLGFSWQRYWIGLPFPSPAHFTDEETEAKGLSVTQLVRF